MASSWGSSWGSSWAGSWGNIASAPKANDGHWDYARPRAHALVAVTESLSDIAQIIGRVALQPRAVIRSVELGEDRAQIRISAPRSVGRITAVESANPDIALIRARVSDEWDEGELNEDDDVATWDPIRDASGKFAGYRRRPQYRKEKYLNVTRNDRGQIDAITAGARTFAVLREKGRVVGFREKI